MRATGTETRPLRWPRRVAGILAWTAGLAVGVPLVAVAALLVLLNTGVGRRLVARQTGALTGGAVTIAGLSGTLPWNLRVAHIALGDAAGTYATLDSLHLRWAPLALLTGTLRIPSVSAGAIDITRLPHAAPTRPSPTTAPSFRLPLRVVLGHLAIRRLTLGAPIAGTTASLVVTGHADLASLSRGTAAIRATRLDAAGAYSLAATLTPRTVALHLRADEPNQGLIAAIANLPHLNGKLHLDLSLAGPRRAAVLHLALAAGKLTAHAGGTLDLPARNGTLDLAANAPAMAPAPGLSWQSVAIAAHLAGPWARPEAQGSVAILALKAGGGAIARLDAAIHANHLQVVLDATAQGLVIPGPKPDLLAASPVHLAATVLLGTTRLPVTFALGQSLVAAHGTVDLGPEPHGRLRLTLPDLAPLAAAIGLHAAGSTTLDIAFARHGATTTASLSGPVAFTGGVAPLVALIGGKGRLAMDAALHETPSGPRLDLRSLTLDGAALHLGAHGTAAASTLDLAYRLDLPDLAAASPALRGQLALRGTARGPADDLATHITATGTFGMVNVPAGPISLVVDAAGLPAHPSASLALHGTLDGAPLTLAAEARRGAGGTHVTLHALDWKSLHGVADLTLPPGAAFPLGTLDLGMARLGDLAPLLHQPVTGGVTAHIATAQADGVPRVTLAVHAKGVGVAAARIGAITLDGSIADPIMQPIADLHLAAQAIRAGGIAGQARLALKGPADALAINLDAALDGLAGAPARITARAMLDAPTSRLVLDALALGWKGEALRLLAPARITYAPSVSVSLLRLALGSATLDLAGRIAPSLDLSVHLANVTPALAKPFAPALEAGGVIDLDGHLTGGIQAPRGTVRIAARGLRLLSGKARALPPADLYATLGLDGNHTSVDAKLSAGSDAALVLTGTAPLTMTGPLNLAARGSINLAVANPILEANGRHVAGQVAIDAAMRGSPAAPAASGTIRLSGGDVQDYALGAHLSDISALITASGQTVRIEQFLAHAGSGTIRLSGSVGAFAPGLPVDLALRMNNAQPLASDLLTADLDADIALRGLALHRLDASGSIGVRRATITIPSSFPQAVAKLHVIRPGAKPPSPASPAPVIGLDLKIHAQPAIFLRGRGLFARLGGDLTVRGTTAAPRISRGFQMANGSFSLAGANLKFTEGRVSFDGTSVTNRLDPTLHFIAQSSSSGITATLTVGGTASHPTIALSSTPSLPQDEVLAHLLYGVSLSQLSPLQIAAIAQGLYALTGGGGTGPLGGLQNALGLDRLGVGSNTGGLGGASLEAGKYVAPGVYVGATQSVSGATQAQVQIDLTKRLKLNTQVNTGGGTVTGATPNGPSSSIGLTYQFEY